MPLPSLIPSLPIRCGFGRVVLAMGFALALAPTLHAQTEDQNRPGPLSPGINRGTLDSMTGHQQFWMVWANPGRFDVRLEQGDAGSFVTTSVTPQFGCAVQPRQAGRIRRQVDRGGNLTCRGTITRRAYLLLQAVPPQGALVRRVVGYDVEGTGPALDYNSHPGAAGASHVTGMYRCLLSARSGRHTYSVARFLPDGRILAPEGYSGRWQILDAVSRIYSIRFDGRQFTDVYRPGQGFVDPSGRAEFQTMVH